MYCEDVRMSIATTKGMTVQEFLEFVHRPENRDRFFELERGEIVEMPPPTKYHGFICGNIGRVLGMYSVNRGRGYVCTNGSGVIVEEDPATVRGPDLSYYDDMESADDIERSYAVLPPLLTVDEVRSMAQKCSKYAPTGVRNRALIIVLHCGALRVSEALALTPSDVDCTRGLITVDGDAPRVVHIESGPADHIGRWMRVRAERGLREVEKAKADGRWAAAYESQRNIPVPPDLQAELDADPGAREFFESLSSQNRYAILYRLQDAKRPETRARRLAQFVAMLEAGERLHP